MQFDLHFNPINLAYKLGWAIMPDNNVIVSALVVPSLTVSLQLYTMNILDKDLAC